MHLAQLLNRDFRFGFHHFEPAKPILDSISDFYDHEIELYSRRFRVDEKEGVMTLSLDLPGFKSADLDIELEQGILKIKAKNARDEFEASVNVGREMDPDTVAAKLEDGILSVSLGKHASAKPRKVTVK